MAKYELRKAFPLNDKEFSSGDEQWICHLAEVSDLRPEQDELTWYLVFERTKKKSGDKENHRKLEIVTGAQVLQDGWKNDLEQRLAEWLSSGEEDGRKEWREG